MKRDKNKKIAIFISIFVCITLVCGFVVFSLRTQNEQKSVELVAQSINLNTETTDVSVLDDIAKIDIISPGLDTYSLDVVMYDLKSKKILSTTAFKEGVWETGITKNGYYIIDLLTGTAFLYSNEGKIVFNKTFDINNWNFAAVSHDRKYILYSSGIDNILHLYNTETDNETTIESQTAYIECIGYSEDKFHLKSVNADIASMNPKEATVNFCLCDSRLDLYTPYYSFGTTDYNFIAATSNCVNYIPIQSMDELIVGVGKSGFATVVSTEDSDIIRNYNIVEKTMREINIDAHVEKLCFIDKNKVIAVTGNPLKEEHMLYLCDFSSSEVSKLDVYDKDIKSSHHSEVELQDESNFYEGPATIKGVPIISQFPDYPTGCETISTIMALNYFGEDISADEFIDEHLAMSDKFYYENGVKYGPSPYEYFIGNPKNSHSYGCMATVIEKALVSYFGNSDRVINTTGTELDVLCREYIDKDISVIVWATINMLETNPKNTWYLDATTRFSWPGNEHCMLLVGYDSNYFYFNDPYYGKTVKYERQKVIYRYAELGHQSVVITK